MRMRRRRKRRTGRRRVVKGEKKADLNSLEQRTSPLWGRKQAFQSRGHIDFPLKINTNR